MSRGDAVNALRSRLGSDRVSTEPADLARHAHDALGPFRGHRDGRLFAAGPAAVVHPRSTDEVVAVVQVASAYHTPLVPLGGRSGLMGGGLAGPGEFALDLSGLRAIRSVSAADRAAEAEAGVVLADLVAALEPHGLVLGHDPWTVGVATVGGAISTNGLGYLAGKYGSMGQQVLGLEVVLASGEVLRTRAAPFRSAGPDLARWFVAAEGTLGIITAAALRVFPRPERRAARAFRFADFPAGFAALLDLFAAGIHPAVLDYGEEGFGGPTLLYLIFEGFAEEVDAADRRAASLCRSRGADELPAGTADGFWAARHEVAERYAAAARRGQWARPVSPDQAFDFVHLALPPSRVLEYREKARDLLQRRGVAAQESGLWVEPGLYSLVLFYQDPAGRAAAVMADVVDALLELAQALGGSMEYCHGVGIKLAHLMEREHGSAGLAALRAVKRALDPLGLLNPGKLGL